MHNTQLKDVASERYILAGIVQFGSDAFLDVSDLVNIASFSITENQVLYKCLELVVEKKNKIDIPGIIAAATELGVYESVAKNKKDIEYLRGLQSLPVHLENVRGYAKKLAKLDFAKKGQEKLLEAYHKLGEITGSEDIDSILSIPEKAVFSLVQELNGQSEDNPVSVGTGASEILKYLAENPRQNVGIPTPYPIYNKAIGGGLRRKGINLIGARTKAGKSIIAKETGLHVAFKLEIPVLYLDTEMERPEQLYRILASMAKVKIDNIETGNFGRNQMEYDKLLAAAKTLESNKLFQHKSVNGKPFNEILSIIRRWILKEVGYSEGRVNDCLVIYDYFKMMDSSNLKDMKEYEALGYQLMDLSDFSKEFDFACLSYVQMNRDMEIAQSDRLRWFAHSYSQFYRKTADELQLDGPEKGNRRLEVLDCRFGGGLPPGDYINMQLDGEFAILRELDTKNSKTVSNNNEFEVSDNDTQDESTSATTESEV
jgi:replicative DNA helicase